MMESRPRIISIQLSISKARLFGAPLVLAFNSYAAA
jgi:hypothetical protein